MQRYTITIDDTGETYANSEHQTLLAAMAAMGKKGIPLGCRGGGCGVCKIEVICGSYRTRVMSREHVSEEDEANHRVLACRVWPTSDLRFKVLGKFSKNLCRGDSAGSKSVVIQRYENQE
jgi:ferredoxin